MSGWTAEAAERPRPLALADDFDEALCTGDCPGAVWYFRQEVEGRLSVVPDPRARGGLLLAEAGPRTGRVPKAALVARFPRIGDGQKLAIAFDVMIPRGKPLNSVHLLDLECADCGMSGNPGIRLYLRRGRLRIDRAKIGIEHAWTDDAAPQLEAGRLYRIEALVDLAPDDRGGARVLLDGRPVLEARGRTLLPRRDAGIDRIQLGITATSNDVPAAALFDNFSARTLR
ncbi:hypothetical protein [Novosphingopyxis sp. YJ-S2-01]|uniref:hypothetical protein n=1 Tax=Novosphingopyxis sp. YJ-S2-01 TaxID=2794021 RepID=UPI0018DB10E4|nr:hypothetical protein [Novosphingopyxis sp. YJ-S2-01]MBH9536262.1 hypothetical protein [Novosphingopyxis sp. YJ-S2-01]